MQLNLNSVQFIFVRTNSFSCNIFKSFINEIASHNHKKYVKQKFNIFEKYLLYYY